MKQLSVLMVALNMALFSLFAEESTEITSVRYWLDDNHSAATHNTTLEFDLDCSSLSPGLHTLNYHVIDNNQKASSLYQHSFYKMPSIKKASTVKSLQYWWDEMTNNAITEPYSDEELILTTDILPLGLHTFNYRIKDDVGRWSQIYTSYFYKGEHPDSARIVSYSYWWNDLKDKITTVKLENPVKILEIDEILNLPDEARTGFAGHYMATLNLSISDNHGRSIFITKDVEYPDNDAPETDIDADKYVSNSDVTLTWNESSNDLMKDYNVYYSKDGEPFLLWLPDTNLTSSVFIGEKGSTYVFTVTGRDAFGNREKFDESKCVSVTFE